MSGLNFKYATYTGYTRLAVLTCPAMKKQTVSIELSPLCTGTLRVFLYFAPAQLGLG
jgi:hypothetical protein